jgi:hypothetical protein
MEPVSQEVRRRRRVEETNRGSLRGGPVQAILGQHDGVDAAQGDPMSQVPLIDDDGWEPLFDGDDGIPSTYQETPRTQAPGRHRS